MKFKPCCERRCLLGSCQTRENGGCYCLCRLKDQEGGLLSLIEGSSYRFRGMIIYEPARKIPLEGEEKKKTLDQLDQIRKKIKEYEIEENQVMEIPE